MTQFQLLIDGKLVPGATTMEVVNPATGDLLAVCPRADAAQLEQAVQAAKRAFPAWAARSYAERRGMLNAIAGEMESRIEEFARLLTQEQGKPLEQAMMEIGGSVYIMRILASFDLPEKLVRDNDTETVIEHRTPLGVVAAITPWNFPISLLVVKLTPALLAGNTVVSKPAPTTPLTSLLFAEIAAKYLPAGVLNVITDQNDLGAALTRHPDVAKISFTGSSVTGKKVMEAAASSLKRLTLELGGNDAAIVLDDVNPKEVAAKLLNGAMANAGQICLAIKRIYVHSSQYDEVCDEMARLAGQIVVGDGLQQGTMMGPLQNKAQFEKVKALIEESRQDGKIIAGGVVADGPGYFIPPTVVRDIADTARLVREEQFGPVVPVLRYETLDEVLERANDSIYGLGGTVWTGNPARGLEVAKRIDSGTVWVNNHMNIDPMLPAGGSKQSGFGAELGIEGLMEFTQNHVVFVTK